MLIDGCGFAFLVEVGEVEGEVEAGFGIFGIDGEGLLIALDGCCFIARIAGDFAEHVERLAILGVDFCGGLKAFGGGLEVIGGVVGEREVVDCRGVVRVESEAFLEPGFGGFTVIRSQGEEAAVPGDAIV
ncbi:MAG: hypothetical protein RI897_2170 [Verrucomicrobiota bacterium]